MGNSRLSRTPGNRSSPVNSLNIIRLAALAALILLSVSACNTTPGPSPIQVDERETAGRYEPLRAAGRVDLAVSLLEQGKPEEARVQLAAAIEQQPKHSFAARRLLRQLDEDPATLLGQEYFSYRLKRGESLALLARRHLGDGLFFYALARYNGIDVPRRVSEGQSVLIPIRVEESPASEATAVAIEAEPSADESTTGAAADAFTGRIFLTKAAKLAREGDVDGARKQLAIARGFSRPQDPLTADVDNMSADLDRREAGFLLHQANAALATGDALRAHGLLTRSVKLDTADEEAKALLAATTTRLVAAYHRSALAHLRVGKDCSAMDDWRKILRIDPGNAVAEREQHRVQTLLDARRQRCVNI